MTQDYDPTLQSPSERRNLLSQGILRLRRLFVQVANITTLRTDTITERTPDAGVTIDTAQIKDNGIVLIEAADHPITPVATKGQGWVKTATPNEFWFTDDEGNDVKVGANGLDAHAKYTDAEAISAVEGEATLDLTGDVTIDGNKSLSVDVINEKDSAAGVTIDGVVIKDSAIQLDTIKHSGGGTQISFTVPDGVPGPTTIGDDLIVVGDLEVNTINERSSTVGVTVESVLLKDGLVDGVDIAARDHAKYTDAEALAAAKAGAGIADDDLMQVDDADAADDDYAKFTANGLEGRSFAEVRSDINVADGADVTGSNAPQAHAASHKDSGSDEVATATPGANAIIKADADGKIGAGWLDDGDISHDAIADVSADDHHAQAHAPESHTDTDITGAELETLSDTSDADSLHGHSNHGVSHVTDDHAESHDVASHSDTTGTGAELDELTDGSETTLHSHAGGDGERILGFLISDPGGDALTTGNTKAMARIPSSMNGYELLEANACVTTVSSSGPVTIQVAKSSRTNATTRTASVNMLSTPITVDVSEFDSLDAATEVVQTDGKEDVVTGDQIRIDVDAAGTGVKGLFVELIFGP